MLLREMWAALLSAMLVAAGATATQQSENAEQRLKDTGAFVRKQHKTPEYRESVRKSVLSYEGSLSSHCADVVLEFDSSEVKARLLGLIESNVKGETIAGAWRDSIPGVACSQKRMFNVQVEYTPHGPRFTAMFPGESAADPELQHDTFTNIERNFSILRLFPKRSCKLEVIDNDAVGPESTVRADGTMTSWKETWDVQTCDKVFTVPVTFTPDATGTGISVGTSDIQPR